MQETFADTSAFPGAQGCGACNVCQGNFLCIVVPDEFQNGFCLTCSLPAPGSSFPVSAFFRKYGKKSTPAGEKTGLYMQLPGQVLFLIQMHALKQKPGYDVARIPVFRLQRISGEGGAVQNRGDVFFPIRLSSYPYRKRGWKMTDKVEACSLTAVPICRQLELIKSPSPSLIS